MASLQERRSSSRQQASSSRTKRLPSSLRSRTKKKGLSFAELHSRFTVGLFCFTLVLVVTLFMIIFWSSRSGRSSSSPSFITPLPAPKVLDLPQFKGKHQEDLLWGTYRPHLYLGIRARIPKSLLAGLMWITVKDGMPTIRHTCEVSDNLRQYGWLRHDGVSYGRQEIMDGNAVITTTFLKERFPTSGYGGDWVAHISIKEASEQGSTSQGVTSVLFYIADEAGSSLELQFGKESSLVSGVQKGLGGWQLHAVGKGKAGVHYAGYSTIHMHNLTQLVQNSLWAEATTGNLQLPDIFEGSSNVAVFQFNYRLPFEVDLVYISGVGSGQSDVQTRVQNLSGDILQRKTRKKENEFEERVQQTFHLKEKGLDDRSCAVGKAALSNLLGGIGYFFGQSRIAIPSELQAHTQGKYWLYWPAALYTAVPSRSVFPRGFLWDEGFHQLLIWRWDKKISKDILAHWLDLININGWIPREQILGSEARSKVPEEFILQHTSNANPPTLFLVFQDIILEMKNSPSGASDDEIDFLKRCFPRLEAWFNWFNTTQVGRVDGSYFWHGRDASTDRELNPKTLMSGLDDYPRASHPSSNERHLDLRCWMALAAKSMAMLSASVGAKGLEYERTAELLLDIHLLNKLHFDSNSGYYADFGNHTEKVKLSWKVWQDPKTGYVSRELIRVTNGRPHHRLVPHFGYVSLFPFMMKIIPADSPILQKHLDLIQDEKLLWTRFGLRSLANTSSLYMRHNTEHDPPYWRGAVWINLNYLVLASLNHYAQEPGPYKDSARDLYIRLRENLMRNIMDSYYKSGYLWEQYEDSTGRGKGAHPFTGWTSLVLLIMAERF